MIRWELVDTAAVPGGTEPLRLWRRGAEWSIRLGTVELMNSRRGGSEEALGRLGCAGLPSDARVLIGGLGLGFTLRAALAALAADAAVTVAELVPAVVAWARGPLAALHAGGLDDPRTTLHRGDVADAIAAGAWDAILLDVDNGPAGQVAATNDRLYAPAGLASACRALRPGGRLAVWSERPDPSFAASMRRAGFATEQRRERSGPTRPGAARRGAVHTVWIGERR